MYKKGGCPGCKITNAINRQVISPDMKAVHAAGDRSNKQTRNRALNLGHRSNKKRTHEPAASNKEQNTLWYRTAWIRCVYAPPFLVETFDLYRLHHKEMLVVF